MAEIFFAAKAAGLSWGILDFRLGTELIAAGRRIV
jgi:hypothetical protein